jgi:transposase-like protein
LLRYPYILQEDLRVSKPIDNPFKWHHFQGDVILLTVRCYLRYSLSFRGLEEILLEHFLSVDHSMIFRWVQAEIAPFSGY